MGACYRHLQGARAASRDAGRSHGGCHGVLVGQQRQTVRGGVQEDWSQDHVTRMLARTPLLSHHSCACLLLVTIGGSLLFSACWNSGESNLWGNASLRPRVSGIACAIFDHVSSIRRCMRVSKSLPQSWPARRLELFIG